MWVGLRALQEHAGYGWVDRALAWVTVPFTFFGTAVMLFFIVSGFAIHYPYAASRRPFAWREYAIRRVCRIYPPYLAAVVLTMVAERVAGAIANAAMSSPATVAATIAMAQNYAGSGGQMAGNPVFWSLPVEMELYLAYPVLLWCWTRVGTPRMLAGVAAVSIAAAAALLAGYQWPTGNFAKYWIIWVSGAALAEGARAGTLPRWRPWYHALWAGGLGVAVAARLAGVPSGIEHFIWAGLFLLLMLWGLTRPAAPALHPAVRKATLFLSQISYSLYLVHYPLLLVAGACWVAFFGGKPVNVLIPLAASLLPIPLAYVMWRYVEAPAQRAGRALSKPVTAPLGAVVAVQ
jgi:peptidoglycan/LPS O-acetylase OafA/YrhL